MLWSDNVTRDVSCDNPVAITAVKTFRQHPESAPDRLVGVGDTARVRAAHETLDQVRYFDTLFFTDLEVPDNIDGGTRGDERNSIDLFLGELPVCKLDNILATHVPARDIGRYRKGFLGCTGDSQDLDHIERLPTVNVVDHGAVFDPPDKQPLIL